MDHVSHLAPSRPNYIDMPPLQFAAVGMSLPLVFHDLTPQPEPRSMRFWHVLASQSLVGGLGWGYEVQRPFETNWGRYLMFFSHGLFQLFEFGPLW